MPPDRPGALSNTRAAVVSIGKLSFVREDAQNCWADLAPVRLGGTLVPR